MPSEIHKKHILMQYLIFEVPAARLNVYAIIYFDSLLLKR